MSALILGISAYYHDSAAALISDGEIVAAAQEERFSRLKHDEAFPARAIQYVLGEAGAELNDLAAVAFYDKPLLKFERLLETSHAFAPRGLLPFLKAMPIWAKEKLFMRRLLRRELSEIGGGDAAAKLKILFPEHHLSHAASAFYPSPFQEAAILAVDGVGEWTTTSISHGSGNRITRISELHFPHSVGLLYSAATYYCGFKVNSGEYKLMGLAPFADQEAAQVQRYRQLILTHLVDLKEDGSIFLDMEYFAYTTGLTMCHDRKWAALFGIVRREPESELTVTHLNLALAFQLVTEEIVLRLARTARRLTGSTNLVLAGGVALNCVANGKLQEAEIFERLWIQPAAGDAGGALGAALAAHHIWQAEPRFIPPDQSEDAMRGALLGPAYGDQDIRRVCRKHNARAEYFTSEAELLSKVAGLLAEGQVVGWFQGRMEYGPRALGNRSILADPRNPEMQSKLNLEIKFRESFRPFAAAVLAEDVAEYFDLDGTSPYMLLVRQLRDHHHLVISRTLETADIYAQISQSRSTLPAITHVDFSTRLQTVDGKANPRFWQLLHHFKKISGVGMLVNTSFNRRGEPIVCTPEDAYQCFMDTGMNWLVINNYLFGKLDSNRM